MGLTVQRGKQYSQPLQLSFYKRRDMKKKRRKSGSYFFTIDLSIYLSIFSRVTPVLLAEQDHRVVVHRVRESDPHTREYKDRHPALHPPHSSLSHPSRPRPREAKQSARTHV